MAHLLEVSALQARYDRSQVLFDIHFKLQEGEIITLLGRNGMGKSTSIKCVMGMLASHDGNISFAGKPLKGKPSFEVARLGIGLVPEGRLIFPTLTVEENLLATAANRHELATPYDLGRVYEFFPRLKERRTNMGNQLSIWRVLGALRKTGMSMIVVDKNLAALLELADHHYVIEKGRVVWSGSSMALKQDTATVESFLGV
jgi:branched-chain amino acid transport system ATP-binding protein